MNAKTETKVTIESLSARIDELTAKFVALEAKFENRRGPKSDRQMTEADAKRIMMGDLKDASHKKAAEELGLSYGQIYSARKGFTFKDVFKASSKK